MNRIRTAAALAIAPLLVGVLPLTACAKHPGLAPGTDPTPTLATSPTPSSEPRRATVVMNGDLLWHNTLVFGAQTDGRRTGKTLDFEPLLAGVRPVVESADLAICHNEVPVAPKGGPYEYYPTFSAPEETLDAVKALGYDACTTGSNHSLDQGFAGLTRTLDALDARGLPHNGTARTEEEARTPTIVTTGAGVRIAIVEGTYGTNGIPLPEGKPWAVQGIRAADLIERAKAAREAGADLVLVAVHDGEEYQGAPTAEQEARAEELTRSEYVDLVYGHHVHVVQPITKKNGTWVVYGVGNLVATHKSDMPRGYEGITPRFTFTETAPGKFEVTEAEYFPTMVTYGDGANPARTFLVNRALADGTGNRARLLEARDRTNKTVRSLGNIDGLEER